MSALLLGFMVQGCHRRWAMGRKRRRERLDHGLRFFFPQVMDEVDRWADKPYQPDPGRSIARVLYDRYRSLGDAGMLNRADPGMPPPWEALDLEERDRWEAVAVGAMKLMFEGSCSA